MNCQIEIIFSKKKKKQLIGVSSPISYDILVNFEIENSLGSHICIDAEITSLSKKKKKKCLKKIPAGFNFRLKYQPLFV